MPDEHAGTYVKCTSSGRGLFAGPDAYLVLYLLHSGRFLYFAYWRGFELTVAAGTWTTAAERIVLHGVGRTLQHDVLPFSRTPRPFVRTFGVDREAESPRLTADGYLDGWDLLGRAGPLHYLGLGRELPFDDPRLPGAWADIEPWIGQFLGAPN